MRRIFLTSGLVLCLACPAFAVDIPSGTSTEDCDESVLGSTTGPVDFSSEWRPMISGAIALNSNRYVDNNGTPTLSYTATTAAAPTPLYAVYGVGVYSTQPTVGTLSNFTTSNRLSGLSTGPVVTGYNFGGFYTTQAGAISGNGTRVIDASGNFIYTNDTATTQFSTEGTGTTWYARWTPSEARIHYGCGGNNIPYVEGLNISLAGTAEPDTTEGYYDGSLTLASTEGGCSLGGDRGGYHFGGWECDANGATGTYTSVTYQSTLNQQGVWTVSQTVSPWKIPNATTCEVVWTPTTFNISYVHGTAGSRTTGFSGSVSGTTATFGQDPVVIASNGFSIPGYTFAGWSGDYDNDTGNETPTDYNPNDTLEPYLIGHDLTLTAQWTPNNYYVYYRPGAHGSYASGYTDSNNKFGAGASNGGGTYDANWSTKSFAASHITQNAGYTFCGWSENSSDTCGSNTILTAGAQQSAVWTRTSDLVLYAIYSVNARPITYSCGGMTTCGTPPSNGSANYGQSYNLSSTYGSCAKEGHHATGWDCSGGATLTNATGSQNANTWSSDETISCTVHWVANTVNLNYYQDTNANSTFTTGTCNYGSTFNLPSSNLPTKPGYHKTGWNIRGNGSPSACDGQTMNCGNLENLDTGAYESHMYFAIGWADNANDCFSSDLAGDSDPNACNDDIRFSDLTTYGWKVESDEGHWLYGTSKCSAHSGDHNDIWDVADLQDWTATTSQLTSAGNGRYCWCKAVGYNTDGESSLCNTESPAWVFVEERADAPACADTCAQICAEAVRAPGGGLPDYDAFRSFLHGVQ